MKKFLLSLFVGFVGIISFCSAGSYTYSGIIDSSNGLSNFVVPLSQYSTDVTVDCVFQILNGDENANLRFTPWFSYFYGNNFYANSYSFSQVNIYGQNQYTFSYDFSSFTSPERASPYNGPILLFFKNFYINNGISASYSCTFVGDKILSVGSCPECPTCPEINTGEILSGYILESEIDTNYCVGNGLCPNECGSGTDFSGDLQYSNIYINSILHPGEENIFIDIPDYIQWDYSVTTGEFNIYVGSGYDMDYMNSIIKINSYRPTSTDFTDVFVSGLTLIFPYIFVVLLLMFIWKLLKRIFK